MAAVTTGLGGLATGFMRACTARSPAALARHSSCWAAATAAFPVGRYAGYGWEAMRTVWTSNPGGGASD